ncbi:MAG: hypothetical protein Kow00124_18580 [Anaerolineae bacterium]
MLVVLVPPGTLPFAPGAAYSDAAIAHWPAAESLRRSVWEHGQWPLWNPDRMLGQPFAANPLNKVWYPPQWLALLLPPTAHLTVMLYVHMLLLALGMVAWARAERLAPAAALFAALAWGLSPKLIAHLGAGHLDLFYAAAWVPWVLWAARRLIDAPGRARAIDLGALAALVALADVRLAFYCLPLTALYGAALAGRSLWPQHRADGSRLPRLWVAAGVGAVVFLLLTAVITVPLLAPGPALTRAAITPQEAAAYSLPPRYLAGFLLPDAGGFHEWMTYSGLPVLGLALLALRDRARRPAVVALWAAALLALLWALGEHGPLFELAAAHLPLVSWFRVPARALFVTALCLALLGAYGMDSLLREPLRAPGKLAALGAAFFGLAWAAALAILMPDRPVYALGGLALLAAGLGVWLGGEGLPQLRQGHVLGPILLVLTLAASLGLMAATLLEGRPLDEIDAPDRALIAALAGSCRAVYSPSFYLIGPAAARAGVWTLHAVDPYQLTDSARAVAAAAGVTWTGYTVVAPPLPEDGADPEMALSDATPDVQRLADLGVELVAAGFPLDVDGLRLEWRGDGRYLYRVEALRDPWRASPDCERSPNRPLDILIDTTGQQGPLLLTVTQAYAPGWQAIVSGERTPVQRTADGLIGVTLPPGGPHRVELIYRPLPDLIGLVISMGGLWLAARLRERWSDA